MQEILFTPIQVVQKQITAKYWTRIFLNGAATLFLDDDQINLVKVILALVLPIAIVYAKAKVSELSTFLLIVAKAVSTGALCHQACS